jgi:hypothetical protein
MKRILFGLLLATGIQSAFADTLAGNWSATMPSPSGDKVETKVHLALDKKGEGGIDFYNVKITIKDSKCLIKQDLTGKVRIVANMASLAEGTNGLKFFTAYFDEGKLRINFLVDEPNLTKKCMDGSSPLSYEGDFTHTK